MKRSKALLFVPALALIGLTTSLDDTSTVTTSDSQITQSPASESSPIALALSGTDKGGAPEATTVYNETASFDYEFSTPPADFVGPPAALAASETARDEQVEDDASPASPRDKMSGPVAALAAIGGPGLVDIVVRYDEHPALFDDEYVASLGGEVVRRYQTLEMRAIRIPAESLEELAVDDNVDWMSVDDDVAFAAMVSHEAANLPGAQSSNAGYSGSSVGIAILDSGVSEHADLNANVLQYSFLDGAYPIPEIVNGEVTGANASVREDAFGHGTHVAGILSGDGTDSQGAYSGSADGATLL